MTQRFWMTAWLAILLMGTSWSQNSQTTWTFAVSGDSRNCGDVIMPAIAQRARRENAQFYWHLGDLRAIYAMDEDMQKIAEVQKKKPFTILGYEQAAWDDFIQNQIVPFGDVPFFLGIGNHETISPKTREQFIAQFGDWLDQKQIHDQRLKDHPDRSDQKPDAVGDHRIRTYYHWQIRGIDFINLDNASEDQFDSDQVKWFNTVIGNDSKDAAIYAVVVGMHAALPESFSRDHSMNEWLDHEWFQGEESGKQVYMSLVEFKKTSGKSVYLLASHSHFFMSDIYNTEYWRQQNAVLPGWIVGTGGAQQYSLPPDGPADWKHHTYGFLLGTVHPNGSVDFHFVNLDREKDIPQNVKDRYTSEFVDWCYEHNRKDASQAHDH